MTVTSYSVELKIIFLKLNITLALLTSKKKSNG